MPALNELSTPPSVDVVSLLEAFLWRRENLFYGGMGET